MSVFTQDVNIKSVVIQMEVDAFFLNSVTANNASANRDGCEEQMSRPPPTATSTALTDRLVSLSAPSAVWQTRR